ncbi:MAG TPA: MATE family efflux transporter, partial [Anaerolinea sp.]|nr:MATE family efflux transporter [Anaerolinea sp.]
RGWTFSRGAPALEFLPPGFRKSFLRLFLPAATQNLFFSLIGILDVLMLGQLGDVEVSAVGLSGQFFFLLSLTLFGITSGAAVFAA